jgi:hypothetical protein
MTTNENPHFQRPPVLDNMTMHIELDQDLHRHLQFRLPDTGMFWYDIVTIPGELIFTGDVGAYVFRREENMLNFFGRTQWNSKPEFRYWAEKVIQPNYTDTTRRYSEEIFKDTIEESLEDADEEIRKAWREHLEGYDTSHEKTAYEALEDFHHGGYHFNELYLYEFDFHDFTSHFIWACHAILHATNIYRQHSGQPEQPQTHSGNKEKP